MNILQRTVCVITLVPTRMLLFLMGCYKHVLTEFRQFLKFRFGKEEDTVYESRKIKSKVVAWQKGDSTNKGRERSQYFSVRKASWLFAPKAAVGAVSNEEYHHRLPCWQ